MRERSVRRALAAMLGDALSRAGEHEPTRLPERGADTVGPVQLVVEDPLFVEPFPGEETDSSDYRLLREYWLQLVELVAAGADSFEIHCWTWDDEGRRRARAVGGVVVGPAGDTIVLTGKITRGWVSHMAENCWGSAGELLWMNVVLYRDRKIIMQSSHHGGDLRIWVARDDELTGAAVRAILPAEVDLIRLEHADNGV